MLGKFQNRVAFITGASSGIGEALARELASQGAMVAIAARRTDRLKQTAAAIEQAGGQALALACDVTRDGDPENAVRATIDRFGHLDIVVANAGFGVSGPLERIGLNDFRRQFETNVFGVLRTIYASLGELKRTRGVLVLVGSVNSYLAVPGSSAYSMSKFAVRALAEAIELELRSSGVAVTLVCPGFIKTEIRSVNNRGELTRAPDPIPQWLVMPRASAARRIARAIARRRREVVLTNHGRAAVFLTRHTPWFVRALLKIGSSIVKRFSVSYG